MIIKKYLTIISLLITCSTAHAKDLQHFNPEVFGQSTKDSVKLLYAPKPGDIEPVTLMVDVKDGIFHAATVTYPKKLTVEEARQSLNKLYKTYEKISLVREGEMGVWRVENKKFAIMLTREQGGIKVLYLQFMPKEEVFRHLLRSMGVNTEKCTEEKKQSQK
jgi:hypothetical protein